MDWNLITLSKDVDYFLDAATEKTVINARTVGDEDKALGVSGPCECGGVEICLLKSVHVCLSLIKGDESVDDLSLYIKCISLIGQIVKPLLCLVFGIAYFLKSLAVDSHVMARIVESWRLSPFIVESIFKAHEEINVSIPNIIGGGIAVV